MLTRVSIPMGEVNDLSLAILDLLEDEHADSRIAAAACALTLARLVKPNERLEEDMEISATKEILSFANMTIIGGSQVH